MFTVYGKYLRILILGMVKLVGEYLLRSPNQSTVVCRATEKGGTPLYEYIYRTKENVICTCI